MLVREGSDRNEAIDLRLASCLAAIAGALNAAAFYAVGFFSANMTGNISSLSNHAALGQWGSMAFYAAILLAFMFGAMASALMISRGRRRKSPGTYGYVILVEAVLLAGLGAADLWLLGNGHGPALILGLAFLMGLQNSMTTRISGSRIRTTHISGTATDIGIGLATMLDLYRGREHTESVAETIGKLKLHLCTILSFLLGGVIGVLVYRAVGGYLLIASAAILLAIGVGSLRSFNAGRSVSGDTLRVDGGSKL